MTKLTGREDIERGGELSKVDVVVEGFRWVDGPRDDVVNNFESALLDLIGADSAEFDQASGFG